MARLHFPVITALGALFLGGCGGTDEAAEDVTTEAVEAWSVDQKSYNLGSIGAFAEMVDAGVKTLALSAALEPDRMDRLVTEAEDVARDHDVRIFRESEFLVTDLFSPELTAGKDVLVIYRGDTLDRYLALKDAKASLLESGGYEGEPRREIARRFGRLLSYSEAKIEALLEEGSPS